MPNLSPGRRPTASRRALPHAASLLTLLAALTHPAAGQLAGSSLAPAPEPVEPDATLDVLALLESQTLEVTNLQDPIWSVAPGPGRTLVELPLVIAVPDQPARLGSPPVSLRGGRFLFFCLGTGQGSDSLRGGGANRLSGAPMLARSITADPDGTLRWDLDRVIPGGEIREGTEPYMLKLRPDRMRELEPQRPERPQRNSNESPRDFAERQRAAELAFRDQVAAFRELRTQVRDLPDGFAMPMPPRVGAVYEVAQFTGDLNLTGDPPMPWSISASDLELLRSLAGRSGGRGETLDPETLSELGRAEAMVQSGHPLTHRLVAAAVNRSGLAPLAEQGDPLFRLSQAVVQGPDDAARRLIIEAHAAVSPPTPASTALLASAAGFMDPQLKLLSLRGALQADASDPAARGKMLGAVNTLLGDAEGPDAGTVIGEVLAAIEPRDAEGLDAFARGVRLASLPAERRGAAVARIIDEAPHRELASRWLRDELLSAADPAVVRQTLEQLASTPDTVAVTPETGRAGRSERRAGARGAASAVFGESGYGGEGYGPSPYGQEAPARPEAPEADPSRAPREPITITSGDHPLLGILASADTELAELAWSALGRFTLGDAGRGRNSRFGSASRRGGEDTPSPYVALVTAGVTRPDTPESLVPFLVRQTDPEAAPMALMQVVIHGDEAASRAAGEALLGSEARLGSVMQSTLAYEDRARLARRLYEGQGQDPPAAAGLLREPEQRSQVVEWFGQQVAAGELPDPGAWAGVYPDDDHLLGLAANGDADLAAAAVAALVAAAGGDQQTLDEVTARITSMPERNPEAVRALWAEVKREVYARQLAEAAGRYRMTLEVTAGRSDAGPTGPRRPDPGFVRIEVDRPNEPAPAAGGEGGAASGPILLGLVDLLADGQSIRLAAETVQLSVADQRLAIRIADPAELKNFENDRLADLPLDEASAPLDLVPQPGGAWRGEASLPDGRAIVVTLEPID